MTVENQNFTVYAGDTKFIKVDIKDGDTGLNITTLSGLYFRWVMWNPYAGTFDNILIEKTTSSGIEKVMDSYVLIHLNPEDTEEILPANYYKHELEMTDLDGNVATISTGYITVKESRA